MMDHARIRKNTSVIMGRDPKKYALNPGIFFWLVPKKIIDSETLLTMEINERTIPIGWKIPL